MRGLLGNYYYALGLTLMQSHPLIAVTGSAAKDFWPPPTSVLQILKECMGPAAQGHLLGISREIF